MLFFFFLNLNNCSIENSIYIYAFFQFIMKKISYFTMIMSKNFNNDNYLILKLIKVLS